ncbi:hypothetical protein Tco_0465058 [Tanacetum coccineum]
MKKKYNTMLARLITKTIYVPKFVDWEVLNRLGCAEEIENVLTIKVMAEGDNEIVLFESNAWRNAFSVNDPKMSYEFFVGLWSLRVNVYTAKNTSKTKTHGVGGKELAMEETKKGRECQVLEVKNRLESKETRMELRINEAMANMALRGELDDYKVSMLRGYAHLESVNMFESVVVLNNVLKPGLIWAVEP